MPYSAITSNRMAYQMDGTAVYYKALNDNNQWDIMAATKMNGTQSEELNNENIADTISSPNYYNVQSYINLWLFFPEKRTITAMHTSGFRSTNTNVVGSFILSSLQGSNDTTNGVDGTWETATFPNGTPAVFEPTLLSWRSDIKAVSLSTSYRAIRMLFTNGAKSDIAFYSHCRLAALHLYGSKAVDEQPDDLVFFETDGITEMTTLNDFGDRPEASVESDSFKIKNVSPDKTAATVNVTVTHTDFLLSLSETGPWTTSVDFANIAANTLSDTIYIKNELGQPPLTLGPKAAKCTATVGSWV